MAKYLTEHGVATDRYTEADWVSIKEYDRLSDDICIEYENVKKLAAENAKLRDQVDALLHVLIRMRDEALGI